MSEESAFLDAIRRNPDDDVTRLVYADWLDERGGVRRLARSEFLRLECEFAKMHENAETYQETKKRLHELGKRFDIRWLRIVSKVPIENCKLSLSFNVRNNGTT